jgi:hypothetical protein
MPCSEGDVRQREPGAAGAGVPHDVRPVGGAAEVPGHHPAGVPGLPGGRPLALFLAYFFWGSDPPPLLIGGI